ncbi:cobalamin biosynthesis protein CobW [Spartobacteria bacterium LR76]|nr:cobalamin biosynthesis protein CobW [Spartobacteria bacterium LR76]
MATEDTRVPVTILTGFLGAGKTTLLNRILTEEHGLRIAVIENEFGEIGIDHELVINTDEELFEMNNGCICCTVRGDLIRILGNLMKRRDKFDHILIETTGLADPGPVVQTFFADEEMQDKLKVNAVVTLVDAKHILLHIDDSEEAKEQIAFADVIILNKSDLVTPAELDSLERRIRGMNALAKIHRTTNAQLPIANVLDVGGFNLDRAMELDPHFLEEEDDEHDHSHCDHEHGHCEHDHDHSDCDHEHGDCKHEEHHHHHHHHHDETVTSVALEHVGDCDGEKLNAWLSELLRTKGQDIFRTKGIVAVRNNPKRIVFQGVHMIMNAADGGPWGERQRKSVLVFIGRHLDRAELTKAFQACTL